MFDLLIKLFSQTLAQQSYLKLVSVQRPRQIASLETHLADIWKTRQYRQYLLQSSTALASAIFLKIGFKLNRAPYLAKIILYSVRGQALLALFRSDEPQKAPLDIAHKSHPKTYDYIVIGSGAAGSTVAYNLSRAGKTTLILEEGAWFRREDFQLSTYNSIQNLFKDQGMQFAHGRSLIPVLQGSCVGGTTVINGAICHPLPKEIYESWNRDHEINKAFSWQELSQANQELSELLRLNIGIKTSNSPKFPLHHFLDKRNLRYQMMNRSAPDCQETGRCLQGCPTGAKLSMENSLIPKAIESGAQILPRHKVSQILIKGRRASAVSGFSNGIPFNFTAKEAIILTAGAIHSPWLISKSGMKLPHLGRHFQCHLGVSSVAKFPTHFRTLQGPLQGTEITQFSDDKIKLATQLIPIELLFARSDMDSQKIVAALESAEFYSAWMGSVQSEGEGYLSLGQKPKVNFNPTRLDLLRLSRSLNHLKELFDGLQATDVYPGILNKKALELSNPECLDSQDFLLGIGHIFGTCRMGSHSDNSVTDFQFKVHGTENLYCCDASVFPTNIGVNPQMTIMSLAQIAAQRILKSF